MVTPPFRCANEQDASRASQRPGGFLQCRNQFLADWFGNDEQVSMARGVNLPGMGTLLTKSGEEVSAAAAVEREIWAGLLRQLHKPAPTWCCNLFNVPSQKPLPSRQTRLPRSE